VNERSEAAAQKITEIKNNTKAAIAKLVSLKILLIDLKNSTKNKTPDSKIDLVHFKRFLKEYGQIK
jgi:hypothetical protein